MDLPNPKQQTVATEIDVRYNFRLPSFLTVNSRVTPATSEIALLTIVTKYGLIGVPIALST